MAINLQGALKWVADKFSQNPANMLIWTGAIGWLLSSAAQIVAIMLNPKISEKEKSFLIPQEMGDAAVNILSFLCITNVAKMCVNKLFQTGKLAPEPVRNFLNKNPLYKNRVGKIGFNLDEVITEKHHLFRPYDIHKSLGTTAAAVGGGILATNIVTPLMRNNLASRVQKTYMDVYDVKPSKVQMAEANISDSVFAETKKSAQIQAPEHIVQTYQPTPFRAYSGNLRI